MSDIVNRQILWKLKTILLSTEVKQLFNKNWIEILIELLVFAHILSTFFINLLPAKSYQRVLPLTD